MTRGFRRELRVNDLLQTELARILQKEAGDLGFGMVTVTGVSVTHDLAFAKVFVSVLEEDKAAETIAILNDAAKQLRHLLSAEVRLRITPELKFVYDDSIVRGNRINSIIDHALKDNKK